MRRSLSGWTARRHVQLEQRASSRSLVESYRTSRRASGDPCDSLCMAWMWVWWVCWCSPLCTLHAYVSMRHVLDEIRTLHASRAISPQSLLRW